MKKILSLILSLALLLSISLSLTACNSDDVSRMEVDINPSVEFMLDKNGNVASVTALNEDGSVIVSGEDFVGKSADEVITLIIEICKETGYIPESTENYEIKVSLTGNESLYKNIRNKVNSYISENNLNISLKQVDGLTKEQLIEKVKLFSDMTQEELNKLSQSELLTSLKDARVETANLISEDMKNMYYQIKDSKIQIARSQEIYSLINSSQNTLVTEYGSFLNAFENAITTFENASIALFAPDGAYQQAYNAVISAKKTLNDTKNAIAGLNLQNAVEKLQADALNLLLPGYETTLQIAENLLIQTKETAQSVINGAITTLKNAYQSLSNVESQLKSLPEISEILDNNLDTIEEKMNQAKDNAITNFETEYSEMISTYNQKMSERKNELMGNNQ